MSTQFSPLENLHIASPCHASWDAMTGDDQTRFCKSCSKNVFNLSMMTRAQAENLIREKEGKLCVRYAQRADGTVITTDCPVGAAAPQMVNNSWRWLRAGFAASLAALCVAVGAQAKQEQNRVIMGGPPVSSSTQPKVVKGEMVAVPQPAAPLTGKISVSVPAPQPAPPNRVLLGEPATLNCSKPSSPPVKVVQGGAVPAPPHAMGFVGPPETKPATKSAPKPAVKIIRGTSGKSNGPKVIRVAPQKSAKAAQPARKP